MTDKKKNEIEKTEGNKASKRTNKASSDTIGAALKHADKIGVDYHSMAEQMSPLLNAIKAAQPIQNSMINIAEKIAKERKDLFDSILHHGDEVLKTQNALETAAKSVNASVMDIKKIAEMTNSTYTTLKNLQSMGGVLGTISAYFYLKQLSALEDTEFKGLEDSTDSEIEIIEPYKGTFPKAVVDHPISQDEFQALQKHYDNEVSLLKQKITELEVLVNQIKGTERNSSRGANQETRDKIMRLVEFRNEEIKRKKIAPQKLYACQSIPIDSKTVQKYASKLWNNWKDTSYQWDGVFDD